MSTLPNNDLETFDNARPDRDYTIHIETAEFTCLCPMTGQPDFATIKLDYVPGEKCVELKSFKLYMWTYREQGGFHEVVTNQILDDLVAATNPKFMRVTGIFNVRGGVYTNVVAEHRQDGWVAPELVQLP